MGYTTDFEGVIKFDKPLTGDALAGWQAILDAQYEPRWPPAAGRPTKLEKLLEAWHVPKLPSDYPLQWEPAINRDGVAFGLCWDGGEKSYDYVAWMTWIMDNIVAPAGVVANGTIQWHGEEHGDMGQIVIEDNKVSTKQARIIYE